MKALLWLMVYVLVVTSASAVAYSKHLQRRNFFELQQLQERGAALETEWERLLLEESTWADQSRIEKVACERLGMHIIARDDMRVMGLP